MGTISDVLRVARGELGYYRYDDPQTGTKYGRWYADLTGESYYGENGVAFCCMFVSWVLNKAGVKCAGLPAAYCPYALAAGKRAGKAVAKSQAQAGDIVYFDWNYDGESDHVGIVEANHGTYYQTIEGNTNGGRVARRTRSLGTVCGIIRPDYTPESPQKPGEPINDFGLAYRAHVKDYGWLPAVRDGQTAGTTGRALRMEAFKIGVPVDGLVLEVTVHCENYGDMTYKGVRKGTNSGTSSTPNDPIMGSVGMGRRLEGFSIKCTTNTTGRRIRYRAHVQNEGWQAWKYEGEYAGTRGKARRVEAIQIEMV